MGIEAGDRKEWAALESIKRLKVIPFVFGGSLQYLVLSIRALMFDCGMQMCNLFICFIHGLHVMNLSALVVPGVDISVGALIALRLGRAGWVLAICIVCVTSVPLVEVPIICYRNEVCILNVSVCPGIVCLIPSWVVSPIVPLVAPFIS